MIGKKQQIIIDLALENGGSFTYKEALNLIGNCYYHNSKKYVSEALCRMVKSGIIERVAKGSYMLKSENKKQNKLEIFN